MKLKVHTPDGSSSEEKDFPGIIEFEGDKGLYALKQVVVAYQANQRQGNASTKLAAEVSGSGKKPFRQKGTGHARQGTKRAPQMRGGGVVHGPKPRDYSQKVNKRVRRLALQRAIFDRAAAGELGVIQRWEVAEPKTRLFNAVIGQVAPEGKILVVDDAWADDAVRAARNLSRVTITSADSVSAYDFCRYDAIVVSESGIDKILKRAGGDDGANNEGGSE